PDASAALRELVRLEAEARVAENNPDRPAWQPRVDLEPLFKFVLSPSQYEQYAQQQDKLKQRGRDNLASAADWLYSDDRDTGRPPTWLGFTQPESRRAVADG